MLPYQCRLLSVKWAGVQSVECEDSEDSGVLRGKCIVQAVNWRLCEVSSVKCGV